MDWPLYWSQKTSTAQNRSVKTISYLRSSTSDNSLLTQLMIHFIKVSRLIGLTHASISDGLDTAAHAHLTARTRNETTSRAEDIRSDHRQAKQTQTKTYPTARRTVHHITDNKAS